MPSPKAEQAARDVADAFAPALLVGEDLTLVVIVCDADGWSMALRGERAQAVLALEAAIDDARNGKGYVPFNPPVA